MTAMKITVIYIFVVISFMISSCAENPDDAFRAIESAYELQLGVAAVNLTTGLELYYNADTLFATASLIKTPMLVELYRQYEKGLLDPSTLLTVDSTNIYPGSGSLQHMSLPYTLALHDAAILMIVVSDNTATNLVFDKLGPDHQARLDSVNTMMRSLGLPKTEIINKPFGFDTRKDTPFARRYGIGATTPREMTTLMSMFAHGTVISEQISGDIIEIHKRQEYDDLVPRYLPVHEDRLTIAHKTGAISTARTDAGLIFTPSDTIAFAVFADRVEDPEGGPDHKGSLAVSEAAKVMYDFINRR
jgi:beta-lactamase class A